MPVPGEQSRSVSPGCGVSIVGQYSLQTRLLADLIGEHLDCPCTVRALSELDKAPLPPAALLLLDLESLARGEVGARIHALVNGAELPHVALFNADATGAMHSLVIWPGVRGIFSRDVSQRELLKGVKAILAGEYWLPRSVLCAHLEQTRARRSQAAEPSVPLTRKETETLKLLVGGSSNSHIARRLNVSTHTVKTHLYNLFRKIRVSNRVQAAHWAMTNFDAVEQEAP